MLVDKNIIDALKNQGIEPDIPQLDFIHEAIKIQPTKKICFHVYLYQKGRPQQVAYICGVKLEEERRLF